MNDNELIELVRSEIYLSDPKAMAALDLLHLRLTSLKTGLEEALKLCEVVERIEAALAAQLAGDVAGLRGALADLVAACEPYIYPQPDKEFSSWNILQRARAALAAAPEPGGQATVRSNKPDGEECECGCNSFTEVIKYECNSCRATYTPLAPATETQTKESK